MRVITLNYEPLDCLCFHPACIKYCDYCNLVCDTALTDYELGVSYWEHYSVLGEDELGQEEQLLALAEYFEEGRAPLRWTIPKIAEALCAFGISWWSIPKGKPPGLTATSPPSRLQERRPRRPKSHIVDPLPANGRGGMY
ncbi:hypothetical protein RhiJN_15204 [Ceratobasidium sp. AG-Ba]|nr:hypothetical protein RhiJN_15204 [Ceratobasidium sp. AG-Ba]